MLYVGHAGERAFAYQPYFSLAQRKELRAASFYDRCHHDYPGVSVFQHNNLKTHTHIHLLIHQESRHFILATDWSAWGTKGFGSIPVMSNFHSTGEGADAPDFDAWWESATNVYESTPGYVYATQYSGVSSSEGTSACAYE